MKTKLYSPLILTCTKFLPLFKVFSFYWKQLNYQYKSYVISNNFDGFTEFDHDTFEYLNANISFDKDALHFRNTLLYGLSVVKEKYVMLILDDFIFTDIKFDKIDRLVEHMNRHNIDYCSLASTPNNILKPADESIDLGITSDWVGTTDDDYLYKYSIQVCIWKVESLKLLLEAELDITHTRLDTNILNNFNDKLFKRIYTTKKTSQIVPEFDKNDYIVHYIEIMRWGAFNFVEHSYTVPLIKEIIKKFNITFEENSVYKNLLFPGDTTYAG